MIKSEEEAQEREMETKKQIAVQKIATMLAAKGNSVENSELYASLMASRILTDSADGELRFQKAKNLEDLAMQADAIARQANGDPAAGGQPGGTAPRSTKAREGETFVQHRARVQREKQESENEYVIRTQFGGDVRAWDEANARARGIGYNSI